MKRKNAIAFEIGRVIGKIEFYKGSKVIKPNEIIDCCLKALGLLSLENSPDPYFLISRMNNLNGISMMIDESINPMTGSENYAYWFQLQKLQPIIGLEHSLTQWIANVYSDKYELKTKNNCKFVDLILK